MTCCRDEEVDVAGKGHNTMKRVWYLVGVVKLWVWFAVAPKIGFEKLATMLHTLSATCALVLSSYINVCAGYMCFVKLQLLCK